MQTSSNDKNCGDRLVAWPKSAFWDVGLATLIIFIFFALSSLPKPALALWTGSRQPVQPAVSAPSLLKEAVKNTTLENRFPSIRFRQVATVLNLLQSGKPLEQRWAAMTALEQMNTLSTPALLHALEHPDKAVRIGAVQVLGWQKSDQAVDALLKVTSDPEAQVREAAVSALGQIGAMRALPTVQELQIVQPNFYVQQAAYLAEQELIDRAAQALGLGTNELHLLAGEPGGVTFAATASSLYVHREGQWEYAGELPQSPASISVGPGGTLVYLATITSGLYRSSDGGKTWEHIQFGMDTPTQLTVTAVALNRVNAQEIYVALASPALNRPKSPLGIFLSEDGGKNFVLLSESPRDYVTTRLIFNPQRPKYLYGLTGIGTWRYTLFELDDSPFWN